MLEAIVIYGDIQMSEKIIKVGKKFVVVIPSDIRKKIKIKEGDVLKVKAEKNKIILEKIENPYKVLERVIGEPYNEKIDEKKAERFLKNACS